MSVADQLRTNLIARETGRCARAAELTRDLTRAAESRRTGAMADATNVDPVSLNEPRLHTALHVDVDYARYQDEGTGVYGPSGTRIFPKTAKALRFDWPAAGGIVFAKSVAGAPGRHFMDGMAERWSSALQESPAEPVG